MARVALEDTQIFRFGNMSIHPEVVEFAYYDYVWLEISQDSPCYAARELACHKLTKPNTHLYFCETFITAFTVEMRKDAFVLHKSPRLLSEPWTAFAWSHAKSLKTFARTAEHFMMDRR